MIEGGDPDGGVPDGGVPDIDGGIPEPLAKFAPPAGAPDIKAPPEPEGLGPEPVP